MLPMRQRSLSQSACGDCGGLRSDPRFAQLEVALTLNTEVRSSKCKCSRLGVGRFVKGEVYRGRTHSGAEADFAGG